MSSGTVLGGEQQTNSEGDGLGSEVLGWLGSNALGSEALAGKALARRPLLVRKVIACQREERGAGFGGAGQKALTFVQGTHGSIQRH